MVKTLLRTVVCACMVVVPLALLSSSCALGQATNPFFAPQTTFPGGGQSLTADLNGDGKPDLVFFDGTVLLGKGDGTFTTGTAWRSTNTSPQLTANQFTIADFNGDGKPDILVAGPLNMLSVMLGNGDGTFQPSVTTSIGAPATSFIVGDLNGDGKPDVLAQLGSMFFTYLGRGDGTFGTGISSNAVAVSFFDSFADFNGDGKLDLFVSDQGVQLGNGDGTFQALLPFSTGIPGGGGIRGDFNGDGKLDVLFSGGNLGNLQTQLLLGNGDGTFSAGSVHVLPANAITGNWIAIDMNGDGKDDLVGSTTSVVQVLIGNGDGTFLPGKVYNAPASNSTGAATNIAVADFNGDHKKDVAAYNAMLLGNGDGTLQADEAVPALAGNGASGDFDGNGFPDLALVASTNNVTATLNIWLNDGKSNFTLAHTYQIPTPGNFGGVLTISSAIDVNGDGKIDLVGTIWDGLGVSLVTMLGNGDGSFGAPVSLLVDSASISAQLTAGDLNGDGKPDVLLSTSQRASCCTVFELLNNGDGTFTAATAPFLGAPEGNIVLADFNNDKKLDIVVGTASSGIAVALGNGDGTFQPTTFIANTACQSACATPLSGDFNGDGNLDLISQVPNGYQVLLGKGDGTFTDLPAVSGVPLAFPQPEGEVADFDGDGHVDVLGWFLNNSFGLLLGNGDGTFASPFTLPVIDSVNGNINPQTLIADFNGDGRPDIASLSSVQLVWLFNNGPAGTGTTPPPGPPDFSVGSGSGGGTSTVTAGSTATYPISLAGSGGFTGTVSLTCSVAPAGPACSVSPSSVTVNGSAAATATVSVKTTARSELLPTGIPGDRQSSRRILWIFGALLGAVSVFTLFANMQKRARLFSRSFATACAAILLLSVSLIGGCGGGSNSSGGSGGSTATGTTAGNYTVTVTAQSGAAVHKTQLTLTVQ